MDSYISYSNTGEYPVRVIVSHRRRPKSELNLSRGFRTSGVSEATIRKIRKHAICLSHLAQERQIQPYAGKIVNHLCLFITLTLPAQQLHSDQEITKKLLGKFLNICRKRGLLANYLWRAEKQKNGNIHYHILTDSYAPHSTWRDIWNHCLHTLGYLERYQEKFRPMSFREYLHQPFNYGKDRNQVARAFARGKGTDWSTPPATHTEEVHNEKGVAAYLSKYLSKADAQEDNYVLGRTWAASDSLRSATKAFCSNRTFSEYWYQIAQSTLKSRLVEKDYFSIALLPLRTFKKVYRKLWKEFRRYLANYFKPCEFYLNYSGLFQPRNTITPLSLHVNI